MLERARKARQVLATPIDGASLAAFRVLYGALAAFGAFRFLAYGWIDPFYVTPQLHFTYWGFGWVQPLGSAGMHAVFAMMLAFGIAIALGWFYRFAIVGYVLLFTYVELIDVTNYLNHYYLMSLLGLRMAFMPLGQVYGLDARRRGNRASVPRWMLDVLKLQVACVYVYAAIAKLNADWLLDAQPLAIWLAARSDLPVVGRWLDEHWVALAMSWGGFLYDLTIVGWLSWRPTRPFAYALVLVFHGAVGVLFSIGLFPWIMAAATTLYFSPGWPRRVLGPVLARIESRTSEAQPFALPHVLAVVLALLALAQVVVPLRGHLYEGDINWHEQGMRWSWRVLCREKNGSVTYRVRTAERQREYYVTPRRYLTSAQEREMSSQPDLILQLAHRIADDLRARGERGVEVRVDALASLNGRPFERLIDPDVDLTTIDDGIAPATWILRRELSARERSRSRLAQYPTR